MRRFRPVAVRAGCHERSHPPPCCALALLRRRLRSARDRCRGPCRLPPRRYWLETGWAALPDWPPRGLASWLSQRVISKVKASPRVATTAAPSDVHLFFDRFLVSLSPSRLGVRGRGYVTVERVLGQDVLCCLANDAGTACSGKVCELLLVQFAVVVGQCFGQFREGAQDFVDLFGADRAFVRSSRCRCRKRARLRLAEGIQGMRANHAGTGFGQGQMQAGAQQADSVGLPGAVADSAPLQFGQYRALHGGRLPLERHP